MSSFDDRERGEEKRFQLGQEAEFKANARRAKLVGRWVAGLIGLSDEAAEDYAKSVVIADLEEAGAEDLFKKVRAISTCIRFRSRIIRSAPRWTNCSPKPAAKSRPAPRLTAARGRLQTARMIPRYSRPEMAAIWSPESRYGIWLDIETLAMEAMGELGTIPKDAAKTYRAKGKFEVERIDEIERGDQARRHRVPDQRRRACRPGLAVRSPGHDVIGRAGYVSGGTARAGVRSG